MTRSTHSPLHDIEVLKIHDTGKATLFKLFEGDPEDHWIPNTLLDEHVELEHQHGRVWTMTGPEWLLLEKRLI